MPILPRTATPSVLGAAASPLFSPREVLARGQASLNIWEAEYAPMCLRMHSVWERRMGRLAKAMLINALQNKCSPFFSFSLSSHC